MIIDVTLGATAGIAAFPGYQAVGWRVRRLVARAAAGGPAGRHRRSVSPEPGQEPDRHEPAAQVAGSPEAGVNMYAVSIRNAHARQVVAGFAATMPSLDGLWRQVDQALADVPALGAVVARLTAELAEARLDQASLVAAIRAALAAHAEGRSDPLSPLRDELGRLQALAQAQGGERDDA